MTGRNSFIKSGVRAVNGLAIVIKDMDIQTISDFDVQALIDNELSPGRRSQVLEMLKENGDLQRRYQALLDQGDLLKLWWALGERK